jgi:hypothetical protein
MSETGFLAKTLQQTRYFTPETRFFGRLLKILQDVRAPVNLAIFWSENL